MTRAFLCLSLLMTASPAAAMVTLPAEFSEMLAESQLVVHGRVVAVEPYETAGRKTIESRVVVQVVDALKGDARSEVYFRVPGGQIGRYRRIMVGVPVFAPGDEIVVFLRGQAPALPMPLGVTQGVYRVTRASGRAVVTLPPSVASSLRRGDPSRQPLALDAFMDLVRTMTSSQP
jgi:hypothetical protein